MAYGEDRAPAVTGGGHARDSSAGPTSPAGPPRPAGGRHRRRAGLLGHSAVMAAGSLVSRVTGFLRTAVIAAALGGISVVGDAYTTAMFVPGMVYELLLGGILASVVVPLLVRAHTHDPDAGEAYTHRLLSLAVLALGVTTVLAVAAAPLLTALLAGSDATPASRDLITRLGYLILPTIFFYGLAALLAAVLNTRDHFAAPMWSPILNNIVVIATFGLYIAIYGTRLRTPEQMPAGAVLLLGVGTFLGIVVQSLGLWPALRRVGFRWRWRFDFAALRLGELARLGGWAFCYVLVSQVGVLVMIRLANEASASGHAGPLIFNNTYLLMMMAHGIIAVSIITALMPRLSRAAAQRDWAEFVGDLSRGTRLSVVALAPISVAYAVLALPIARTLFEYGAFSGTDAVATSLVLLAASLALIPYSASQLYTFAFYALPDTRTPALINIPAVVVRIGMQIWLATAFGAAFVAAGLMIGNAVSFLLAAVLSGIVLRRRVGPVGMRQLLDTFWRVVAAALGAALVGLVASNLVRVGLGETKTAAVTQLLIGGAAIVAAYLGFALLLRVREVRDLVTLVRSKLGRS